MKKIIPVMMAATLVLSAATVCSAKTDGSVTTDGSTSMEKVIGALGEAFQNETGIAVIVNPENPVTDLSLETIGDIYTGEITNWSEVGGADAEIVLIGREAGSGTRDGFESITDTEDACVYRQELTSTGDVITTVSQNPAAIGYASVASVKDSVKALTVDGVKQQRKLLKTEVT